MKAEDCDHFDQELSDSEYQPEAIIGGVPLKKCT